MHTDDQHGAEAPTDSPAGDAETDDPGFPDRRFIDLSRDPTPGVPDHAAEPGAEPDPLIDLPSDAAPQAPKHALPDDD